MELAPTCDAFFWMLFSLLSSFAMVRYSTGRPATPRLSTEGGSLVSYLWFPLVRTSSGPAL
jgi:hypothetical protein